MNNTSAVSSFQAKCTQRLTNLIKEQDDNEQLALCLFYERVQEIYLNLGTNITFYKKLPEHSYHCLNFLWNFLQYGKPYEASAKGVCFKTVRQVAEDLMLEFNEMTRLDKYNAEFVIQTEQGFFAATEILMLEFSASDLLYRLNFLNQLRECFAHEQD